MVLKGIYFFLFGAFIGWLLECAFKFYTKNFERTPGILNTPFCILYGVGTVVISIIPKITNKSIAIFFLSFVILSILEYITYIILEKIYGIILWNYSTLKFNIKGKVCLLFSIIWAILGTGYIKLVYPYLNHFYNIAKGSTLNTSIMILMGIILTDFVFSSYILLNKKNLNILINYE